MSYLRKAFQINKSSFPLIQHRNLQQYSCNISNVIVILLECCNVATILLKWSVLYVLHYSSPYIFHSSFFSPLSTISNSKCTTSIFNPFIRNVAKCAEIGTIDQLDTSISANKTATVRPPGTPEDTPGRLSHGLSWTTDVSGVSTCHDGRHDWRVQWQSCATTQWRVP